MPQDKDHQRLDLLGRKVYISSTLQFHIANYSALLAKYDFDNFGKLFGFTADISEDRRAQFKSVLIEGELVADGLTGLPGQHQFCSPYHSYSDSDAQRLMAAIIWHTKRAPNKG